MIRTASRAFRMGFLSLLVLVVTQQTLAQPIALTFGERSVTVNGTTPGGDVVLFAVAKEPTDSVPRAPMKTTTAVVLHDDDRDGDVVYERQRVVPVIAVWVAVDVATAQWAASGSPGFDTRAIPLEEFAKHDNAGQLRKLSAHLPEVDVLLVRPNTGAWHLYAAKTSKLDESERGERPLKLDIGHMIPLTESQSKLNSIHKGDILALIEPRSMRFAVVEVGK